MEQSLGLSFLYALGVAIWFVFLFIVGLVVWKTELRSNHSSDA